LAALKGALDSRSDAADDVADDRALELVRPRRIDRCFSDIQPIQCRSPVSAVVCRQGQIAFCALLRTADKLYERTCNVACRKPWADMTGDAVILGLGIAFWCASLAWLVGSILCASAQPWYRRRDAPSVSPKEPVSIVVPTSARDTPRAARDRNAAIESLLRMDYPNYEILLCVDRIDEGQELLSALK